jgi:hypothetical protein
MKVGLLEEGSTKENVDKMVDIIMSLRKKKNRPHKITTNALKPADDPGTSIPQTAMIQSRPVSA